jgi:hypothetical protein
MKHEPAHAAVWSDPPAALSAAVLLVNDLDLIAVNQGEHRLSRALFTCSPPRAAGAARVMFGNREERVGRVKHARGCGLNVVWVGTRHRQ